MGAGPQFTRGQHFRFGYLEQNASASNFQPLRKRQADSDQWFVQYGRAVRIPMNFRLECLQAAREIAAQAGPLPITVLFSGGMDSEVVLRSFVEAGVPVEAAILRFKDDFNLHDYSWAILACENLGVKFKIFDLDLLAFWAGAGLEYAERTQCVSPQLLPTMWLADQIEGFPVLGSGENYLVKKEMQWLLLEKERIAAWYRHFLVQNRPASPGFFQWSPELMLAWLVDPLAIDLWQNRRPTELDSKIVKIRIYQAHFNVMKRLKYTGFEKVQQAELIIRQKLTDRFAGCDQVFETAIPDLVSMLSPFPKDFPSVNLIGL